MALSNGQLIDWTMDNVHDDVALIRACVGLGIVPVPPTLVDRVNAILAHLGPLPAADTATWQPPAAAPVAPTRPPAQPVVPPPSSLFAPAPAVASWNCHCGMVNQDPGRFCSQCGSPKGQLPGVARPLHPNVPAWECAHCETHNPPGNPTCCQCGKKKGSWAFKLW